MKVNGEAVYGTMGSPLDFDYGWGCFTYKPERLYLHVFEWQPQGLRLYGLKTKATRIWLLADPERKPLQFEQDLDKGELVIQLPQQAPDPNVSVIAVDHAGQAQFDETATGSYHWKKTTGIRLNVEKIERQKAQGWKLHP